MPRVLICYIVPNSGHHAAARAIESALHTLDPRIETQCVDLLAYSHPHLAAIIQKTYMTTIRRTPDVWDALYDDPLVEYLTRRIRRLIHRARNKPLRNLMDAFRPDAAICTQAFPLAVMSAYAARKQSSLDLWGVVTDYTPHRFWVVDRPSARYVVPTQRASDRLVWLGIDRERIHALGIPVNPRLVPVAPSSNGNGQRRVLVMGGSRGLGLQYRTVKSLDASESSFTIDVVTGTNRRLRRKLLLHRGKFRHPIRIRGFVHDAAALMSRAEVLISKPGGLTSAEAMAVGLPMVLIRPLPGQEQGNADVLVRHGSAVHVDRDRDVAPVVSRLLAKPDLLAMMRDRATALGRPDAALQIARLVLGSLGPQVRQRPESATT